MYSRVVQMLHSRDLEKEGNYSSPFFQKERCCEKTNDLYDQYDQYDQYERERERERERVRERERERESERAYLLL